MTEMRKLFGVCVAAVALLTACGPGGGTPEAVDPAVQQAPVERDPSPPPKVEANPDVDFAVSPAFVSGCAGTPPLQSTVSWQVRNTAVEQVRVEVADPGQENWKVLSIAGRQGEVETGPWVAVGTRFRLILSATDEQLAGHEMTAGPCSPDGAD